MSSSNQAAGGVPTLSNEQKLQIQVLSQALELAQLRAQMAQRDFDEARASVIRLTAEWKKDGYTLDWQRGVYVPAPAEKPQ